MTTATHYARMGWRDLSYLVKEGMRNRTVDERTHEMHRAWHEVAKQYMFLDTPQTYGLAPGSYKDDRGALVQGDDDRLRFQVYHTLSTPASVLLPSDMAAFRWDRSYVTDVTEAFKIDVRVLGRGSIVMDYYDVVRGEQVEGYGSDFVAMTEIIEARMRAETVYRPRLFAGRAFLTNLVQVGNLTREVNPGFDMLFRATALMQTAAWTRDRLLSGELQAYFKRGVTTSMVADLLGVN